MFANQVIWSAVDGGIAVAALLATVGTKVPRIVAMERVLRTRPKGTLEVAEQAHVDQTITRLEVTGGVQVALVAPRHKEQVRQFVFSRLLSVSTNAKVVEAAMAFHCSRSINLLQHMLS
jgi:hypothetical protein